MTIDRASFLRDGFAVVKSVLSGDEIATYTALARRCLGPQAEDSYRQRHMSIGSLFDILAEPGFVDLIAHRGIDDVFQCLHFDDPYFQHGIVFNKLPHTPRTFWHQDGTIWSHPAAYGDAPHDVIVIYYLCNTGPHNGCLRVIPGSHRHRHTLHDYLATATTETLRAMVDPTSAAYQTMSDEVAVPVSAGDLVLIDARLLHAAHSNRSNDDRIALSLWYLPSYSQLPEPVQARFTGRAGPNDRLPYIPSSWPPEHVQRLRKYLPPTYDGTRDPLPMCNVPGPGLR
ncbi:MAG: phytanoyl-CoA dioxygenase family protein [Proteobacteria bacterium]|nr:phytanoyl-CoA dioxygenase family protein [Pseudomonadota bacterium]